MERVARTIDCLKADSSGVVIIPALNGISKINDIAYDKIIMEKSFKNLRTKGFSTPSTEFMRYGLNRSVSFSRIFQNTTCEQLTTFSCTEHQIGSLIISNKDLFFVDKQIAFFVVEKELDKKTDLNTCKIYDRFALISLAIAAGSINNPKLEVCDYSLNSETPWSVSGVKFFIPNR